MTGGVHCRRAAGGGPVAFLVCDYEVPAACLSGPGSCCL